MGNIAMLLWYCYDDHLAALLNMPELGHVPVVAWFVMGVISMGLDIIQGMILELFKVGMDRLRTTARRRPANGNNVVPYRRRA